MRYGIRHRRNLALGVVVGRELAEELESEEVSAAMADDGIDARGLGGGELELHHVSGIEGEAGVKGHAGAADVAAAGHHGSGEDSVDSDDADGQVDLVPRPAARVARQLSFATVSCVAADSESCSEGGPAGGQCIRVVRDTGVHGGNL